MEQPQRGVLPDAIDETSAYLIKNCSYLRLTYEIRMTAFMAQQNGMAFTLVVNASCKCAPELTMFSNDGHVIIRRG